MTTNSLQNQIQSILDTAKQNGWDALPAGENYFRFKDGRKNPACSVIGALIWYFCKDEKDNLPLPGNLQKVVEGLGVDEEWLDSFIYVYQKGFVPAGFFVNQEAKTLAYHFRDQSGFYQPSLSERHLMNLKETIESTIIDLEKDSAHDLVIFDLKNAIKNINCHLNTLKKS